MAGRFFYEDRWGVWNARENTEVETEVYGESIYTKRWELLGAYEFIAEKCCSL
jgi:outer membrane receptor for ferrienterochelin and colicins